MPNINQFLSSFKGTELARPCNFMVELSPPEKFYTFLTKYDDAGGTSFDMRKLYQEIDSPTEVKRISQFRCEQAELPARAFTLIQQKTYGPLEMHPVQNTYNKIPLTLICSDDMKEKYFFDLWMEMICTSHPNYPYGRKGFVKFDFEYRANYRTDVIIRQLDVTGKPVYSVALRDAFPTEVYSMPLSWSQQNDYHRLNVVLVYRYFYVLENAAAGEQQY